MKKAVRKSKKSSISKDAPPPRYIIQNCNFTTNPANGEVVASLARALEANAQAINALANEAFKSGPMLVVGRDGSRP